MINIAAIVLIQVGAVQVNTGAMAQGQVVALYNYLAQMIVELIKLASLIITINGPGPAETGLPGSGHGK